MHRPLARTYRRRLKRELYPRHVLERLFEDDEGALWQLRLPDDLYTLGDQAQPAALSPFWDTHAQLAVWTDTSLNLQEIAVAATDNYLKLPVPALLAAHRRAEGAERHCLYVTLLVAALNYGLALPPVIVNGSVIWDGYHRLIAWRMTNALVIQVVDIVNFPDMVRPLLGGTRSATRFRV